MNMIEDPRLRIFHVDTECYIVYLGTGIDDYRPFLRIGNSPQLPERVKHFISAVVVSDSLTGNQLIEHENLELPLNGETRYIGDPVEVNKLKQFLDEKDLPVEGYEYEEAEDILQKGGAFVYFYKNGNLHIVHNAVGIFDLQTREREDGHFISRVERVVQAVKANPLRYLPRDLASPGFLIAGGRFYFFRDGRMGTIGITPDYIVDLGRYGFDPDLLLWLVEDRLSEGLLNRFKRATVTKKDIRVATSELPRLQSAVSLFSESGLSCIVAHLEAGESKVFSGYTIERRANGVAISFPDGTGFPEVRFSSAVNADIPNSMKDFLKKLAFPEKDFSPITGVPYLILDRDERDAQSLIRNYLREMIGELKDVVEPSNADFLKYFEALCGAVTSPEGGSGAKILYDVKSKKISPPREPEFEFIYWNLREFSRLWERRKGVPAGIKKHGTRLGAIFPAPDLPGENETKMPVVGEFVRYDGEWYLFYRWNGVLTKLKLLQAQKSFEVIDKLRASYDENSFIAERERLLRFIEGLTDVPGKKRRKVADAPPPPPAGAAPAESGEIENSRDTKTALSESAGRPPPSGPLPRTPDALDSRLGSSGPSGASPLGTSGPSGPVSGSGPLRSGSSAGERSGNRKGRAVFIVLAVLAAGGVVFLVLRTCEEKKPPASPGVTAESPAVKQPSDTAPVPAERPAEAPLGGAPAAEDPKAPSSESRPGGEAPPGDTPSPASPETPPSVLGPAPRPPAEGPASIGPAVETVPPSVPGLDPEQIPITVLDVFYLVNTIAVDNGYRPLDEPKDLRPDPNWIFPGNSFNLPDSSGHTVVLGDTLWDISIFYIRKSIRKQVAEYNKILEPYYGKTVPPEKKEQTSAAIRKLKDACISEKLRGIFSESLRELGYE